jgi:hypothetical protein
MKRLYAKPIIVKPAVAAAVVLGGLVLMSPAGAAPPTVVPSPGYDARLQEQRAAQSAPAYETVHPAGPAPRHHVKRTRHHSAY